MDNESLRDWIYQASHRWPILIAFFLVGSLVGWGVVSIYPAPYRATADLYVSLDPYRAVDDRYVAAYAGDVFRNADDYKYWQMEQLDTLIFSDEYLSEALARLKSEDPYWDEVEIDQLRERVRASWRNMGGWRLIAEDPDLTRAAQIANAWSEVVLEKTAAAIGASQTLFLTDLQIQANMDHQLSANNRREELQDIQKQLIRWLETAGQPGNETPFDPSERLYLATLAARAADLGQEWKSLLEALPAPDSLRQSYVPWIDQLLAAIVQETEALEARQVSLDAEQAALQAKWQSAYADGRGLAATLLVERPVNETLTLQEVRSTGQVALVGGLIGVLGYGFTVFASISRGKKA